MGRSEDPSSSGKKSAQSKGKNTVVEDDNRKNESSSNIQEISPSQTGPSPRVAQTTKVSISFSTIENSTSQTNGSRAAKKPLKVSEMLLSTEVNSASQTDHSSSRVAPAHNLHNSFLADANSSSPNNNIPPQRVADITNASRSFSNIGKPSQKVSSSQRLANTERPENPLLSTKRDSSSQTNSSLVTNTSNVPSFVNQPSSGTNSTSVADMTSHVVENDDNSREIKEVDKKDKGGTTSGVMKGDGIKKNKKRNKINEGESSGQQVDNATVNRDEEDKNKANNK